MNPILRNLTQPTSNPKEQVLSAVRNMDDRQKADLRNALPYLCNIAQKKGVDISSINELSKLL